MKFEQEDSRDLFGVREVSQHEDYDDDKEEAPPERRKKKTART